MASLYDNLSRAQGGQAISAIGREFGLSPQQTQAAVAALLPAISAGLKRSTATPEGLGRLFGTMAQQRELRSLYDDTSASLTQKGRDAGNEVLSVIFGSPEVSRAISAQAQKLSGIDSGILKKLLPVLAGILISGMMGGKSGATVPTGQSSPSGTGGGLWDILGQIFGQGGAAQTTGSSRVPPIQIPPLPTPMPETVPPMPAPAPRGQPLPGPLDGGAPSTSGSGGGLLEQILRELQKGIQEGRIKPEVIPLPGGQSLPLPSDTRAPGGGWTPTPRSSVPQSRNDEVLPGPQTTPSSPFGDALGQILRDLLGGASAPRAQQAIGPAVFGDRLDSGHDVDQSHLEGIETILDRFARTRA
jgi:hypothetical protein